MAPEETPNEKNRILEKYFPTGEIPVLSQSKTGSRLKVYFKPKKGKRPLPAEIPWPPDYRVVTPEEEAKQRALMGATKLLAGSLMVWLLDLGSNHFVWVHDTQIDWPKRPRKAQQKKLVQLKSKDKKHPRAVIVDNEGAVVQNTTSQIAPPPVEPPVNAKRRGKPEWLSSHPQTVEALRLYLKVKKIKARETEAGFSWQDIHGDWVLVPTGEDTARLTNRATEMVRGVSPVNTYRIGQAIKQIWGHRL